ncbi:MAG: InlB B-repeat-containing protein [Holophagales bacterium]|nr:InlB B-repeat-containing protein [Holophagales bacterium]
MKPKNYELTNGFQRGKQVIQSYLQQGGFIMKNHLSIALFALSFMFVGCSGGKDNPTPNPEPTKQTFQVTFVSNGGNEVLPITINSGGTVLTPAVTRNYYDLEGWYRDSVLADKVTFPLTVTSNMNLYAKWELRDYRFDVSFTSQTATINFEGLHNNSIYLVKTNISDSVVSAANTGIVNGIASMAMETGQVFSPQVGLNPVLDEVQRFNANPPFLDKNAPFLLPKVKYGVGESRMFWTPTESAGFIQKRATLRASGQYCNIWVPDEYFGLTDDMVRFEDAEILAELFDKIYPVETNLLGYEFGGGPGGDGGRDGDPKIQILICLDLSIAGLFSGADWYPQSQDPYSNEAEMFYVSKGNVIRQSSAADRLRIFSDTLIHEFQHLINWNQKTLKLGLGTYTSSWYNELLSKMAENAIAFAAFGVQHSPVGGFNISFLTPYYIHPKEGLTEWITGWGIADNSYNKAMLFGIYLMRNYGGAKLLHDILHNDKIGIESITEALTNISPGMTFEKAVVDLGEAMIFSYSSPKPKNALTFDKTVTNTINGIEYTVHAITNRTIEQYFDLTPMEMRPHSISMHQANEWKNKSGNLSIAFERPADPNIVQYLILK